MSERFAYGGDRVGDCGCPAVQAGLEVEGTVAHVAMQYDTYVYLSKLEGRGISGDELEHQIDWHGSIDRVFQETFERSSGVTDAETAQDCFKRAAEAQERPEVYREVADALGWE